MGYATKNKSPGGTKYLLAPKHPKENGAFFGEHTKKFKKSRKIDMQENVFFLLIRKETCPYMKSAINIFFGLLV